MDSALFRKLQNPQRSHGSRVVHQARQKVSHHAARNRLNLTRQATESAAARRKLALDRWELDRALGDTLWQALPGIAGSKPARPTHKGEHRRPLHLGSDAAVSKIL